MALIRVERKDTSLVFHPPSSKLKRFLLQKLPSAIESNGTLVTTLDISLKPIFDGWFTRGIIDQDPNVLFPTPSISVTVSMSPEGVLEVDNIKANKKFQEIFPNSDIVSKWRSKNIEVLFDSPRTKEIYSTAISKLPDEDFTPEGLLLSLLEFQKQNVRLATSQKAFAILDDPGLGKTISAIASAHELINNRKLVKRAILIVPGIVRSQWANEITRFTGNTDVVVIAGNKRTRERLYEKAKTSRWLVCHYDILHIDLDLIQPLVPTSYLIADEAHRTKNYRAKRSKALRSMALGTHYKLALTGTPVENSPAEWYSLISGFISPGYLGDPYSFFYRYQFPSKFGGFQGARNLEELHDRTKHFYIRHTKKEVAPYLPPLVIRRYVLDPSHKYRLALDQIHSQAKKEITSAKYEASESDSMEDAKKGSALVAMTMLRMICDSPLLLHQSDSDSAKALVKAGLVPKEEGPKVEAVRELVGSMQAQGERIVAFTYSKEMVKLLETKLTEDGIRVVTYSGDSSKQEKEDAVTRFTSQDNSSSNPTIFLTTDAGAEGLNLGKYCSTLLNIDIPWTPSRLIQRSNRIHRIDGTSESYTVINMTIKNTVEDIIIKILEEKTSISEAILGGKIQPILADEESTILQQALASWENINIKLT